jgi:PII-like signaling protein
MATVRLYITQDNRRWHEDLPHGTHLERIADLEIAGATIYHASLLSQPKRPRKLSAEARLRQRLY